MTYSLGKKSESFLVGVHPGLVSVVRSAIKITKQDFSVIDGLRDQTRQKALVAAGASRSNNSLHLVQVDGYGWAVDLLPYGTFKDPWPRNSDNPTIRGQKLDCFKEVIRAMFEAADKEGFPLVNGNDWDGDGIITALDPDERGQISDYPHFQKCRPTERAQERCRLGMQRRIAARARGEAVVW